MNSDNCSKNLISLAIVGALINLTLVSFVDITKLDPTFARFLVLICGLISIVFFLGYDYGIQKLVKLISRLLNKNLAISREELKSKLNLADSEDLMFTLREKIRGMKENELKDILEETNKALDEINPTDQHL